MTLLNDGRELWHTPDPDTQEAALARLVEFWQSATISLFIVDYSFNLPIFETLLPELKAKGVAVQLVLDKSQSGGSTEKPIIASLRASGIDLVIGESSMHHIIHDKFSVVDMKNSEYGSFNFTKVAGLEDNFFFIENNSPAAEDLISIGNSIRDWVVTNETNNKEKK